MGKKCKYCGEEQLDSVGICKECGRDNKEKYKDKKKEKRDDNIDIMKRVMDEDEDLMK